MIPLYTEYEFNSAKPTTKLVCKCLFCNETFYLTKHRIQACLNINNRSNTGDFCSIKCSKLSTSKK